MNIPDTWPIECYEVLKLEKYIFHNTPSVFCEIVFTINVLLILMNIKWHNFYNLLIDTTVDVSTKFNIILFNLKVYENWPY